MADQFDPAHAKKLEDPARLKALPQAAVVGLLRLDGAETVVDYGAGTGIYTVAVAAAVPRGRVFAVEALPRLAELFRQKITPDLAARICLVETGDNVVPLDDAEADRVVMVDVLHHLHDQPEALEEVVRVLRPGGLFVVVDWADMERPVGPPASHVLGMAAVRDIIAGMGLDVVETHEPGDFLPYHVVVAAAKPEASAGSVLTGVLGPDSGRPPSRIGVHGGRTSSPTPAEHVDADLVEPHERPAADALYDDCVDVVLGQDEHGSHAAALGVRGVLQRVDFIHLARGRDVDEREAGAAAEVAGARRVQPAGQL